MHESQTIINLLKAIHDLLDTRLPSNELPRQVPEKAAPLFSRKAAADYLLVTTKTITNWRNQGKLPAVVEEGKAPQYRQSDLDRCFERYWGRAK